MGEWLALATSDHKVPGLNPTRGDIPLITVWPSEPSIITLPAGLDGLVGCTSNWCSKGLWFNPHQVWQHSFIEIDHEIFFVVILSLLLIQEGQLSVFGDRNENVLKYSGAQLLVNPLED